MQLSQFTLSGLMIAAGLCVPAMANLNAGLGQKVGSPLAAVFLLCSVAVLSAIFLLMMDADSLPISIKGIPPIYLCGGLLFVFYIISMTFAAPRMGLGNAVFLVLVGQLVSAAAIDHFGLFGATVTPLSSKRLAGLIFMSIGVYLAQSGVYSSSS